MINMMPYFEQWNHPKKLLDEINIPQLHPFVWCLLALSVFIVIGCFAAIFNNNNKKFINNNSETSNHEYDPDVDLALGFTGILSVIFMVIMIAGANTETEEEHIIKDVKTEIYQKFNLKMNDKQIEKLLNDQPVWANQLTKEDIEKYLD